MKVPKGQDIFGKQDQHIAVTDVVTSASELQMGSTANFCHACVKNGKKSCDHSFLFCSLSHGFGKSWLRRVKTPLRQLEICAGIRSTVPYDNITHSTVLRSVLVRSYHLVRMHYKVISVLCRNIGLLLCFRIVFICLLGIDCRWGDTCWGLISKDSSHRQCGCNSGGWAGIGIYYGGYKKNNDGCGGIKVDFEFSHSLLHTRTHALIDMHLLIIYSVTCSLNDSGQGGGFSGPKKDKQQKGNLPSAGLTIKIQPLLCKSQRRNKRTYQNENTPMT